MPRKGFFAATPLREIAELNIGSRPASCKATQAIEDLRAIASVFSWGPCRLDLPGWCGFGSAVEAFLKDRDTAGLQLLQRMQRQWPFFRTLLSNLDMVLAKTDPALARSLEHRIPYLDPLNHLQVELLRRYRQRRADDPESARVQRGIHLSINGLAAGLRKTG